MVTKRNRPVLNVTTDPGIADLLRMYAKCKRRAMAEVLDAALAAYIRDKSPMLAENYIGDQDFETTKRNGGDYDN